MLTWALPRLLAWALAVAAATAVGALFGRTGDAEVAALFVAAVAFVVIVGVDAWRGARLLAWLRGPRTAPAPRDTGFWGELAYRLEKTLLGLDRQIEVERAAIGEFVAAMEASPNGVMLLDAGDAIEWMNSSAADHFGLDPQRDRRQRVTNLIRSPSFVAYLQAGAFDAPVTVAEPAKRRTLSVVARRYGHAGKKLVLSQDHTERERSEAMRRDFVANVSHELKTPLTVLSGFVETMRNLPLSPAEQKRVLALMTAQTTRMAQLVDDLLALARLEGSPRPPADGWFELAVVYDAVEASSRALSASRHSIAFADPGRTLVAGSEAELTSALSNLVQNAIRYTDEGGSIDVGFAIAADGSARVAVRDTGKGIAREHIGRLTERFYRADGGRSRDSGGTGLGLSIVKHVVRRHGGELSIESEPQKGSTFTIVLPATRVRVAGAGAGEYVGPPDAAASAIASTAS